MGIEDRGQVTTLEDGSKRIVLESGTVVTVRPDGTKLVEIPGRPTRVMPDYTPRIMTDSGIKFDTRFKK